MREGRTGALRARVAEARQLTKTLADILTNFFPGILSFPSSCWLYCYCPPSAVGGAEAQEGEFSAEGGIWGAGLGTQTL